MDKTGWTKVKLGDICNIHDKKRKPVSKTDRVDGEYPYYGANGIQSYIDGYLFDGDYILVGEDGSVITENGNPVVNLAHGKFWANNHVHVIDAKPCVDFNYLYQALQLADVSVFVHGNIPKLSQGDFKNIELYLPPMEIQIQIANLLTTIDNIIQSKLDESTKYQNMKTQIMNDIFANGEREQNWTKVKLGDIAELKNGYSFRSSDYDADKSGAYKIVTIKNVTKGKYTIDDCNTISELPKNLRNHHILKQNSILVSMTGATIGKTALNNIENALLNQRVGLIEPINNNSAQYIFHIVHSNSFEQKMISIGHGAAQPNIGKDDIESYELYLPPIEQQTLIANLLTMYDDVIETVNKEKEDYEKIKTQMMNMIFA